MVQRFWSASDLMQFQVLDQFPDICQVGLDGMG